MKRGFVPFPTANVTKLAFGGADLKTVYTTTATKGLSPGQRTAEPDAGHLFAFEVETAGCVAHYARF
jgi:xylono-1,5-lactonase